MRRSMLTSYGMKKRMVKLCDKLCRFIVEAKQHSGEPYSPKSLLQLLNNLQIYANEQNPAAFNFMDSKDPEFKSLASCYK